jgi:amino acid adenylation domain-containing protein
VGATIHARFTTQARTTPNALAAISASGRLRYAELDELSTRLARAIAGSVRPLGKGDRVGLLCHRSADTLAAILAVLKLGATYVPFDLGYPRSQLALMLEDSQPALVLHDASGSQLADELCAGARVPKQSLEALIRAAAHESAGPLDDGTTHDDLAYVMFTSGSHGRPKGVMVRHRGVVRLIDDQSYARFGPDEVFLHMAPLAFDASTFELWGALLNGGAVAILASHRPSLAEIADTIRSCGVTTAWMTAGLFHAMVDTRVSELSSLRQLLAGGDVLSPEHVQRARAALPCCRIINGYGPTENTTFTCCYPIPEGGVGAGAVPIGTAIRGTTVYLLDSQLQPVPDGAEGQLATGGDGVAAGYIGRPDLTSERFIPDPFSEIPGATLYLTGDVARRRSDGQLDFLGRRDRQIKIDGKRIELDEIEAALRRAPQVSDAAVVMRNEGTGCHRLVAYVAFSTRATEQAAAPALATCARTLADALPAHMLPNRWVALAQLPLTAQGKVDRKNLPEPTDTKPTDTKTTDTDARHDGVGRTLTATESELARVWADVLGVCSVEPDVNIFDLGGTSLHVVRIHEQLSRRFAGLSLLTLFDRPSVRALADYLDRARQAGDALQSTRERAVRQVAALRRRRESAPRDRGA